jgi:aspartate-semialdehyde dehydrogenase
MNGPRIGLVGATGAVGREVLRILEQRRFDLSELRPIASRADGRTVPFRGDEIPVVQISDQAFEGLDIAIWDTPDEVAAEWVPKVRDRLVNIDNSAQFRLREDVPLVIPEINPEAARAHTGIIANPNCTMMTLILPLAPLHKEFNATRVVASSYQSTSGAGAAGPVELFTQIEESASQRESIATGELKVSEPKAFTHPIAFNVIPRVGGFDEAGTTSEERRVALETNKVLAANISIFATAVRVPTIVGHGISAWVTFEREVSADQARALLSNAQGVQVQDSPSSNQYPTTLESAGKDIAIVGRIRKDPNDDHCLGFFSTCDNLRKGAALNTVQIAELISSL